MARGDSAAQARNCRRLHRSYGPLSAKVLNIGFAKDVVAVYTPDGEVWKEHPLYFTRNYGTYDVSSTPSSTC